MSGYNNGHEREAYCTGTRRGGMGVSSTTSRIRPVRQARVAEHSHDKQVVQMLHLLYWNAQFLKSGDDAESSKTQIWGGAYHARSVSENIGDRGKRSVPTTSYHPRLSRMIMDVLPLQSRLRVSGGFTQGKHEKQRVMPWEGDGVQRVSGPVAKKGQEKQRKSSLGAKSSKLLSHF
jgi:hypothetical protein